MSIESEGHNPESDELSQETLRLSILQLLRTDFAEAESLEKLYFPERVYVQLDHFSDEIPRKVILLTEVGDTISSKALQTTDRYYISAIDETRFPTTGEISHSGLDYVLIRHIDDEGDQKIFDVSRSIFRTPKAPEPPSSWLKLVLRTASEHLDKVDQLKEMRNVLADYQPTAFPSVDEFFPIIEDKEN